MLFAASVKFGFCKNARLNTLMKWLCTKSAKESD